MKLIQKSLYQILVLLFITFCISCKEKKSSEETNSNIETQNSDVGIFGKKSETDPVIKEIQNKENKSESKINRINAQKEDLLNSAQEMLRFKNLGVSKNDRHSSIQKSSIKQLGKKYKTLQQEESNVLKHICEQILVDIAESLEVTKESFKNNTTFKEINTSVKDNIRWKKESENEKQELEDADKKANKTEIKSLKTKISGYEKKIKNFRIEYATEIKALSLQLDKIYGLMEAIKESKNKFEFEIDLQNIIKYSNQDAVDYKGPLDEIKEINDSLDGFSKRKKFKDFDSKISEISNLLDELNLISVTNINLTDQ